MIERLIAALRATGVEPHWRDVADIVWLAHQTAVAEDRSAAGGIEGTPTTPRPERAPDPAQTQRPEGDRVATPAVGPADDQPAQTVRRPAPESGPPVTSLRRAAHEAADVEASVAATRRMALPGRRDVARALRPLKQRRPSRVESTLDVDRTVDEYCRTGLLVPVMRAVEDRWFDDVAIVVDQSPTMAVWADTIDELEALLNRLGAFDRVSRWSLAVDADGAYLTSRTRQRENRDGAEETRLGEARHDVRHLVDYDGRRLTLVITDCVGPLWRAEHGWNAIDLWGRSGPAALVQVLPERLWPATAMGPADVSLSSDQRGEANAQLEARVPWWWSDDARQHAVPVVTLDADRLQPWARMVMGGGTRASGVLLHPDARPPAATGPAGPEPTPAQIVANFRATVSSEAADLATMLSAVDVSLPVARILLRTLVPHARLSHLAEVVAGGLFRPDASDGGAHEFEPGVREELQRYLTATTTFDVWRAVTPYLETQAPGRAPFSILFDGDADGPTGAISTVVDALAERFGVGRFERPHDEGEPAPAEGPGDADTAAPADVPVVVQVRASFSDGEEVLDWIFGPDGTVIERGGLVRDVAHLMDQVNEASGDDATRDAVLGAARALNRVAPALLADTVASSQDARPAVVIESNVPDVPWHLLSATRRRSRDDDLRAALASRARVSTAPLDWRSAGRSSVPLRHATIVVPSSTEGRNLPVPLMESLSAVSVAATGSSLLAALKESDLVHVALGATRPQRDPQILELEDGSSVTASELAELRLDHGPVVFLDAYRSTRIAPALLSAGASVVVARGWQIANAVAEEVADGFYRHVAEGLTTADALAEVHSRLGKNLDKAITTLAYQHFGEVALSVERTGLAPTNLQAEERVKALAAEYSEIRRTMTDSPQRKEAMDRIVAGLTDAFGAVESFDWAAHLLGADLGLRLAAYVWLGLHPEERATGRLIHSLVDIEEKPFGQLVALRSLKAHLQGGDRAVVLPPEDRRGLDLVVTAAGSASDRGLAVADATEGVAVGEVEPDADYDAESDLRIRAARAARDAALDAADPDSSDPVAVVQALDDLAACYETVGRRAEQVQALEAAAAQVRTRVGASDDRWDPDLAERYSALAEACDAADDDDRAVVFAALAVEQYNRSDPSDAGAQASLVDALVNQSRLLGRQPNAAGQSLDAATHALDVARRLPEGSTSKVGAVIEALMATAGALAATGSDAESFSTRDEALELLRGAPLDTPAELLTFGLQLTEQISTALRLGNTDDTATLARELVMLARSEPARLDVVTARGLGVMLALATQSLSTAGQARDALATANAAVEVQDRLVSAGASDPDDLSNALRMAAELTQQTVDPGEALPLVTRYVETLRATRSDDPALPHALGPALTSLADLLNQAGQHDAARSAAREAVATLESLVRSDPSLVPATCRAHQVASRIDAAQGQLDAALAELDLALRLIEEHGGSLGGSDGRLLPLDLLRDKAALQLDLQRHDDAANTLAEAVRLHDDLPVQLRNVGLRASLDELNRRLGAWTDVDNDLFDAVLRGDQPVVALTPYHDQHPGDVAAVLSLLRDEKQIDDALIHVVQAMYPADPDVEAKVVQFVERAAANPAHESGVAMVVEYALYRLHQGLPVSDGRLNLGLRLLGSDSDKTVRPICYGLGQPPGPPAFEDYRARAIEAIKRSDTPTLGLTQLLRSYINERDPDWPTDEAVVSLFKDVSPDVASEVLLTTMSSDADVVRLRRVIDRGAIMTNDRLGRFLAVYDKTGDLLQASRAAYSDQPR